MDENFRIKGMPFETIVKKFKTAGEMREFYKKNKIKPLKL